MPPRPAGRTRSASAAGRPAAGGVVARAFDHALDNPATSGGLLVVALTATAIISNALFLQGRHHATPPFMTRPIMSVVPTPNLAPAAPARQERVETTAVAPPEPSLAPAAAAAEPDKDLVVRIQRELARLGLYVGAIDGIVGSRTKAAIDAYQVAAGRPATGVASAALLEFMKSAPAPTAAAARPLAAPTADVASRPTAPPPDAVTAADLYRRVQTALNRAGYGPLAVDGQSGGDTADAIRRFELDNGLPITGKADDQVVQRLASIGAMNAP